MPRGPARVPRPAAVPFASPVPRHERLGTTTPENGTRLGEFPLVGRLPVRSRCLRSGSCPCRGCQSLDLRCEVGRQAFYLRPTVARVIKQQFKQRRHRHVPSGVGRGAAGRPGMVLSNLVERNRIQAFYLNLYRFRDILEIVPNRLDIVAEDIRVAYAESCAGAAWVS